MSENKEKQKSNIEYLSTHPMFANKLIRVMECENSARSKEYQKLYSDGWFEIHDNMFEDLSGDKDVRLAIINIKSSARDRHNCHLFIKQKPWYRINGLYIALIGATLVGSGLGSCIGFVIK